MRTTDTIAAISTALTPSGIGIVRLSGDEAVELADRIFKGKKKLAETETHTINHGHIVDRSNGDEKVIDEVLVMLMRAPRTYTGEDTVEIDTHGGVLVMQRILSLLLREGANLAEPGEFTKRAFLNGKMDLAQAEGIADVIEAGNEYALNAGVKQMKGKLSAKIEEIRKNLLHELAYIEAALDDPEHYDLTDYPVQLKNIIKAEKEKVDTLLSEADAGIVMKSGIGTVILGRPNAGKSSVYNLLTGSDRAIVTDIAGTTRDTLTENIRLNGISLNITDTAGLRESEDLVEKIGVDRARAAASDADLILYIIDSSEALTEEDIRLLKENNDRKLIILLNKADLESKTSEEDIRKVTDKCIIAFSAKEGSGLKELEEEIKNEFFNGLLETSDGVIITSLRHKDALKAASLSLSEVIKSIDLNMAEDFFSIDLHDAYESLGLIIGETVGDEIIDEIFSKFCMGK